MNSSLAAPLRGAAEPEPADAGVLAVRSSGWALGVLPGTGASLAYGRVRVDGRWVDLLRPTRAEAFTAWERCASFPLVPWSNRIEGGRLAFRGRHWQLARTAEDGSALHGAGVAAPWRVVEQSTTRVVMELDSGALVGVNFPWQFRARVEYAVDRSRLTVTTSVENTDVEPFPAGFGHHPYFRRFLTAATGQGGPLLHVPAAGGYALDRGVATGAAGPVPARADYRSPRGIGDALVDDVLTGLEPGAPVRLVYPEATVDITMDEVYSHLVVYAPRGRPYFAVEPVTHVNGGFALHEAGVPGTGVLVLEPAETRSGTFTVDVQG